MEDLIWIRHKDRGEAGRLKKRKNCFIDETCQMNADYLWLTDFQTCACSWAWAEKIHLIWQRRRKLKVISKVIGGDMKWDRSSECISLRPTLSGTRFSFYKSIGPVLSLAQHKELCTRETDFIAKLNKLRHEQKWSG